MPIPNCPSCGNTLPCVRVPSSFSQIMWGGWTCPKCGCEIDRKGKKIGSGKPSAVVPNRPTRPLWMMGLIMSALGILVAGVSLPLYIATASHFLKGAFWGGVLIIIPVGLVVLVVGLFRLGKAKPTPTPGVVCPSRRDTRS